MAIKRPKSKLDYMINIVDSLKKWADEKSSVLIDGDVITFNYHCGYGDMYSYKIECKDNGKYKLSGGFGKMLNLGTYERPSHLITFIKECK